MAAASVDRDSLGDCRGETAAPAIPVASLSSLPTVAAVVPCHNYGRFLTECLQSILSQALPVAEVIVVLDGCTDNSSGVADLFRRYNVHTIAVDCRHAYLARRIGLAAVQSDLVFFLDADDRIGTDYTLRAVERFAADERVGLVTGKAVLFGALNGTWAPDPAESMETENRATSAAVCRVSALRESGAFEQLSYVVPEREDYYVWRHLTRAGWRAEKVDAVHWHRRHGDNMSLSFPTPWAGIVRAKQGYTPPPKVRIGFLTPSLATGGQARNTAIKMQLAKRLEWAGTVLTSGGPSDDHGVLMIAEHSPVTVSAIRPHRYANARTDVTRVRSTPEAALALAREVDVMYAWGSITGDFLREIAEIVPVVFGLHGEGPWTKASAAAAAEHAAVIYCVCQSAVALVPAEHRGKCRVIPNGVDLAALAPRLGRDAIRQRWGIEPYQVAVGYVGRISREKRCDLFAEACSLLPPEYRPVVVSPQVDEHATPHDHALRNRVLRSVESLRGVSVFGQHGDMGDVYAALDVLVMPSREEGGPLVTLEAFATGTPVVSTPVGLLPGLERHHGQLAHRISLDNGPTEIADAIVAAAQGRRSPVVRSAREVAWRHLTATRMVAEFEALACSVARGNALPLPPSPRRPLTASPSPPTTIH
ncbi:MAG: glycosyltransferase [Planctomycetaceae bacterium]|nr:glycosyltransferase [Planctomycetaceae bacterium]